MFLQPHTHAEWVQGCVRVFSHTTPSLCLVDGGISMWGWCSQWLHVAIWKHSAVLSCSCYCAYSTSAMAGMCMPRPTVPAHSATCRLFSTASRCSTMQDGAVQYCTVQYGAVQYWLANGACLGTGGVCSTNQPCPCWSSVQGRSCQHTSSCPACLGPQAGHALRCAPLQASCGLAEPKI